MMWVLRCWDKFFFTRDNPHCGQKTCDKWFNGINGKDDESCDISGEELLKKGICEDESESEMFSSWFSIFCGDSINDFIFFCCGAFVDIPNFAL